jgi:recombination protein RecR
MLFGSKILTALVKHFTRMPGIGEKSAQRLALYILDAPEDEVTSLAGVLRAVKSKVGRCARCGNIAEGEVCAVCADDDRDGTTLCVVESAPDLHVIERGGRFRGRYHVLGGVISPLDGVGPEDLPLDRLRDRVREEGVHEVIVAVNQTVEGEATALYIARLLKPLSVRVTRPARGLPAGGTLEYTDEVTLARALEARQDL